MSKVRWGVLSTANIGVGKVIPAMQRGSYCAMVAIASRNLEQAQKTAAALGFPKAYGSYEELLADPEIDAIYNPLPNHLHVPWSIKALEAGKHVLCEKPIGLNAAQAQQLADAAAQHPHLKVMEAFMYRFHPQWQRARELVRDGRIGELRTIQTVFSYFLDDATNIRNRAEAGGGALYDIGCYAISVPRFIFDAEPQRVSAIAEFDPRFGTDRLVSAMLDFGRGTATFTCGTQLSPYQRVTIFGTQGHIEIEIPFNAPPDRSCRIWLQQGEHEREEILLPVVDQYTLQGDAFSRAVLDNTDVPTPITDAVANMRVIDAAFQSARTNSWV
ncbi:MAG: Gfo/Idh/MocA family protein [Ktedonobacterales bacterium]